MCKILVVDDGDDVLELARTHLSAMGHQVDGAKNGEEALRVLAAHEDDLPCLLIVDLRMPILDGWDLLTALRLDARWADLPIIICSGMILPGAPPPVLRAKAYWSRRPTMQQLERIHEHCAQHSDLSWPESGRREASGAKAAG